MLKLRKLHQYNNVNYLLTIVTSLLLSPIIGALTKVAISTIYALFIQVIVLVAVLRTVLQWVKCQLTRVVGALSIFDVHVLLPMLIIVYYMYFYIGEDTEWYYMKVLLRYGHISKLIEMGEPLYYALFPVSQIIGSTFNMISALSLKWSYVFVFVALYEAFILTIYIVLKKLRLCVRYNHLLLTLISTYYLHRAFKDLMQGAFGMYAVSLSMFILVSLLLKRNSDQRLFLLSILMAPLYVAHAAAIYFAILALLLIAIVSLILTKDAKNLKKVFLLVIVIFFSTYAFQISSGLMANLVHELRVRPWQIISSIVMRGFERPLKGASVVEQQKHFIYEYHVFTVPLAYGFPIIVCLLTIVKLIRSWHRVLTSLTRPALILIVASAFYSFTLIGIALLSAYYGIENYIARYLYYYAPPFYLLTFSFVYELSKGMLRKLLEISLLVQFACWITEPFYIPWFSLYYLYDVHQMKFILASNILDHIYNNVLNNLIVSSDARCFTPSSFVKTAINSHAFQSNILYNNDFFVLINTPSR